MLDSQDDAARAIKVAIQNETKSDLEVIMNEISEYADSETSILDYS